MRDLLRSSRHICTEYFVVRHGFLFPFFRAKAYYDDPELRRRRRGQSVSSGDLGHRTPAEATPSSSRPKLTFPPASSDTWTADVESLPSVTVGVLFKFLCLREVLLTNNGTSQLTQKPLHRGYQFYFWSYVHNIRVCQLPERESILQSGTQQKSF